MPLKNIQNESHDWLADAAESLVRYYFSKSGKYYTYGAGKWGPDCVLQDKKTGRMRTVEVKSSDSKDSDKKIHARLKKCLKKKLEKINLKVWPDHYAEVRKVANIDKLDKAGTVKIEFEISFWDINKKTKDITPSKAKAISLARRYFL